jgi:Leucine-rich repeat (LRR) protein
VFRTHLTFIQGKLPPELENQKNLMLDGNKLSGTIPPEIGNLPHLQILNLAVNQISQRNW